MTTIYKVVLSDKLFIIYKKAASQGRLGSKELKVYEAMVRLLDLDILTNFAQLERCKDKLPVYVYNDLQPALLADENLRDLSLTELAQHTLFKLVLTQAYNEVDPPYFNIRESKILREYMINCPHDTDRDYLIAYLKSLLNDAKEILIYDPYFAKHADNHKLFHLLPSHALTIQYVENRDNDNGAFIQQYAQNKVRTITQCETTQPKYNRFARSHDRYLLIDNKLEITLTSGFEYIWNRNKEITCVIRELTKS